MSRRYLSRQVSGDAGTPVLILLCGVVVAIFRGRGLVGGLGVVVGFEGVILD